MSRRSLQLVELSRTRVTQVWRRQVMFVGATLLTGFYFDPVISAAFFAFCLATELIDLWVCKRILRDRKVLEADLDIQEWQIIWATALSAIAVGLYAVAIAIVEGPAPHLVSLFFLFSAALNGAMNNHQVRSVLMVRLVIYGACFIFIPLYDLVQVRPPIESELWLQMATVVFVYYFIIECSYHYMRNYEQRLDRISELRAARDSAREATESRSAMISTMSHELRTPLNGILGMAQVLRGAKLTDAQQRQVDIISVSGRHLNTLLTDILDTEKLMAGRLHLTPINESLSNTLSDIVLLHEAAARSKNVMIRLDVSPDVPNLLRLDSVRLTQCVNNLVSNAIKFTASGHVDVKATFRENRHGGQVVITVSDTGIGMSEDEIGRVFKKFSQGHPGIARSYGGTGLGLWISRNLSRMMGGDLTVESTPGVGSTFRLSLAAIAADDPDTSWTGDLSGLRVLHIDDAPVNHYVVRLLLASRGVELTDITTAAEALEIVSEQRFDVVLCDINLPGMSGFEFLRRFRETPEGAATPVIGVSADSGLDPATGGSANVFDAFVHKPVDERTLLSALRVQADRKIRISPSANSDNQHAVRRAS